MEVFEVRDLHVQYGRIRALHGLSFSIEPGKIVALIGANGAGKTTTLRALSGLIPVREGTVRFGSADITNAPAHEIVRSGVLHCPEGRRIFRTLTVDENLDLGAFTVSDRRSVTESKRVVFSHFPILFERRKQLSGNLSGGEQQMLAIGRALMARPKLLMLDEPSLGLAPMLVKQIFRIIEQINRHLGVSILLVEQNARIAVTLADTTHVIERGQIKVSGSRDELAMNSEIRLAYLGARLDRRH
jgi:branched-chain amino acid transport system ATP-binding protein